MMSYTIERCCMRYRNNSWHQEQLVVDALLGRHKGLTAHHIRSIDYISAWAKMNGVLFLLASCIGKSVSGNSAARVFNTNLAEQKLKSGKMSEAACDLLALFEKHGIRLLPIKTFLQYPYVDDDLDIVVVDNERLDECRKILLKNGYRYLKSRSSLREPKKRFYFPKGESNAGLRIHIHFAVSWNGVDYLDIKKVYERRRPWRVGGYEIPIPSLEDEILIMAAHAVHENRYILLGEMLQFRELTSGSEVDWDYIVSSARKYHWLAGLFLFLVLSNRIMQKFHHEKPVPDEVLARLSKENDILRFMNNSLNLRDVFVRPVRFPVTTPFFLTSLSFFDKLFHDLKERKKSARELGREFIAYTLVDWAVYWRFQGDLRRLNKLK